MRTQTLRTRTLPVAAGLAGALAVAACSAVSTSDQPTRAPSAAASTPTAIGSAGTAGTGPSGAARPATFRLPRSACDLADMAAVERLTGRSPVAPRSVAMSAPKQGQTFLSCAFTAGFVPVGALTVGVRDAGRTGVSAREELDDSVSASEYGRGASQDVTGLGDAARYGTTPSLAGITFATIWVVEVRGTQVLDLSVTSAAKTPSAARDPLVAMARTALAGL
ncbi:hypothetical protein [Pseudofrankia inefficax]|uniref:DUF3558 domain-containing protein n=1 Tax=Pseudofrankia inefficax (strain DSM 45817 / CECT 9037 / DDB 130130 / EuI1c) TaxID=298654 RepID=E3J2R5_PSEI1|nr:hypothetical protein [Pseudofrankia inefficax]ADP81726.1 hypothetical protein FraEuI1c_3719 [Pseudofrankia inefficax]